MGFQGTEADSVNDVSRKIQSDVRSLATEEERSWNTQWHVCNLGRMPVIPGGLCTPNISMYM
jgi:hypothetical protein